ncbi:MAG TPA: signal peptidase I [Solirubrobacteraceae bacterium]
MTSTRLRSKLLTAAILLFAIVGWVYLAPPQLGGSTNYVITHGTSMEPTFHAGDLGLVRPADHYRVGEIVAYHSTLLRVVVLHRIIAIDGGHYVFKGDNNNFVDPTRPTRSELLGALWIHVPNGGAILRWLHSPVTAAVLCGFVALLLVGTGETKRRRKRRGNRGNGSALQGPSAVTSSDRGAPLGVSVRSLLIGVATLAVACAVVAAYAKTRPAAKNVTHQVHYTQNGRITYHATAHAGPVYPNGRLATGDPIFLQLVHRVGINVAYRFEADAPARVHGTQQVLLQLTGPNGWTRRITLSPLRHFTGAVISTPATIDLRAVQALLDEVQSATGISATGASLGIVMKVHVNGTVAGRPVDATFAPVASFQLQPLELIPGGGAPPAAAGTASSSVPAAETGLAPSAQGKVTTVASVPNAFSLAGHTLSYSAIARLALVGFLLTGALSILLAVLLRRNQAFDEAARIRARYAHLLVPILIGEDLGWPPVDVTSFKALVRLAESAGQLILHHQADAVDTYLVNDNGTVYRYQITLPLVTWGEWTETNVAADPAALADAATVLAEVAAPTEEPAPTAG